MTGGGGGGDRGLVCRVVTRGLIATGWCVCDRVVYGCTNRFAGSVVCRRFYEKEAAEVVCIRVMAHVVWHVVVGDNESVSDESVSDESVNIVLILIEKV